MDPESDSKLQINKQNKIKYCSVAASILVRQVPCIHQCSFRLFVIMCTCWVVDAVHHSMSPPISTLNMFYSTLPNAFSKIHVQVYHNLNLLTIKQ